VKLVELYKEIGLEPKADKGLTFPGRACAWLGVRARPGLFQGDSSRGIRGLHGLPPQGFIQLDRRPFAEPSLEL
jgi:hypothetical protein